MKNLKFSIVTLLLGTLLLAFSCTKDEMTRPVKGFSDEAITPRGDVITLSPTGGDDTYLILSALNTAGPGDVVALEEGLFRMQPIYVEDFQGSFVGAGMEETIIEPYGPLHFPGQDFQEFASPTNPMPFLITFRRGNLYIGDMTLRIPAGTDINWTITTDPTAPWELDALGGIILVTGEAASSVVERVAFEGAAGSFYGYNLINAYYIESALSDPFKVSGTHAVYSSSFRNAAWGASFGPFGDVRLKVGGSPSRGNICTNVAVGIEVYDFSDSQVEVSYNRVVNPLLYGMSGIQGLFVVPHQVSNAVFKSNQVVVSGNADGVFFQDLGPATSGQKTMNLKFSNNRIHLNGTYYGGLFAAGVQDALVKNNQFRGDGGLGIYFNNASGWTILGNNLQHLDPAYASIWLMPGTSNNTVAGGGSSVNAAIIDDGVDNIITGFNNQGNPPGPAISQAMQQQHELWRPW